MPRYRYEGYKQSGIQVCSVVAAPNKNAARVELETSGMLVTSIRPVLAGVSSRVKPEALSLYNQELLSLIKAGIPLVEAIKMVIPRKDSLLLSSILERLIDDVSAGRPFSEACEDFPEAFDAIYIAAIRTSENTGNLADSLNQYQHLLDRQIKIRKDIKHALYYPAFLLFAVIAVLIVLFVFVVPSFSELYESFDASLPLPTLVILAISKIAPVVVGVVTVICVTGVFLWRIFEKSNATLLKVDSFVNRIIVIGKIRKEIQFSQVMRMLSGLVVSGTPLLEAMKITAYSYKSTMLGDDIGQASNSIESGGNLCDAFEPSIFFSSQSLRMIQSAERSGALGDMLAELAIITESNLETHLKQLTSLFEPIIMLLLGLIVGAVILSMYLPIFYLADIVS